MRVELHGDPPNHIRETLTLAGLQITRGYDQLHLVWPDEVGKAALVELADRGQPALAILEREEQMIEVVLAGAAGVVSGTDPQRLRVEIECHLRLRHQLAGRAVDPTVLEDAALCRTLIRAAPDSVICADTRGRITHFSQSAVHILGYPGAYATTQLHVTDIYANPTDARRVMAEIRVSPDRVLRGFPVRLRARSGESIPVLLNASEVSDENGNIISSVGVFRDRRTERDLRQRLNQATQQLFHSEKRASSVTSTRVAIHELNQPLTALMGALELIDLHGELPESVSKRFERMYSQLDRMADIVRSLGQLNPPGPRSSGQKADNTES